ncbi:MAG: WG repeat-containing protein [Flavisolibacter sp.]
MKSVIMKLISRFCFFLLFFNTLLTSAQDLIPYGEQTYDGKRMGYRDPFGKIIVKAKYYEADPFKDGLGKVTLLDKDIKWRYGFVDSKGNEIIPLIYSNVMDFSEGLVGVQLKDKMGFLNREGKTIIPIKYERVDYAGFKDGLVGAKLNGKWGFIDRNGNAVIPFIYSECKYFAKGLAPVSVNGIWGFVNTTGKLIVPAIYSDAKSFTGELSGIQTNKNKWAVINTEGKVLTGFKYDDVHQNFNTKETNLAVVSYYDEKLYKHYYGVVDNRGKEILPVKYANATIFSNDLIRIKDFNERVGLTDGKGKTILPVVYKEVYILENDGRLGFLYDEKENKKLFLANGDKIEILKYQDFAGKNYGRTPVKFNGKWGYIDESGKEVIPTRYDTVDAFYKNNALVVINNKIGIIDRDGKEKVAIKYDAIDNAGD